MNQTLFNLARGDRRFAYEAYEFVCEAVNHTQDVVLAPQDEDDEPRHIRGDELLRGGCELARHHFGDMAPVVFRHWGVNTTEDFGEIVFRLVNSGKLHCSDDDDPMDYHDTFDLMQVLREGFDCTPAQKDAA